MRQILIGILAILLIVMSYIIIFEGINLGNLSILSANQIIEENEKLASEITSTEKLINVDYPTAYDNLNSSVSKLMKAKNEYKDIADISTKAELNKASITETYTVEFLWTILGRHATEQGVNLNYTPTNNTINFTVTAAEYTSIWSFVSAIENDSRLGFKIENFKLVPASTGALQATFTTKNVTVKTENASSAVSQDITSTENDNTTDVNTEN